MEKPQIKEGRHYFYKRIEFWAENGLVTVVDQDKAGDSNCDVDLAIKRLRPVEFLKRAAAVRARFMKGFPSDRRETSKLMEEAEKVVKQALAQGDPCDPTVQEYTAKHAGRPRVTVPACGSPRFKISQPDDPRDAILDGVRLVPDLGLPKPKLIIPGAK